MIDPFKELDQRPAEFEIGATVFGCFQIIDKLGAGAMGVVYKVRNTMLDKLMALKVLPMDYVSEADFLRFQNEARALSKLDHPNIARVYDFGLDGRTPYLSMDFANGPTLQSVLAQRKTLPLFECLDLCLQMCDGLAHAHEKSVVHRDIKPGNIILAQESDTTVVKIVDFGVAKLERPGDAALTQTGAFVGSPLYASPEQAQGQKATPRSDMYSFGCVMFQCLTGEAPFQGDTILDTLLKHSHAEPPIDKLNDFPESVQKIMRRLLAKDPDQRFASMKDVGSELRKVELESELDFAAPKPDDTLVETGNLWNHLRNPKGIALSIVAVVSVAIVLAVVQHENNKSSEPDPFKVVAPQFQTGEALKKGRKIEDARVIQVSGDDLFDNDIAEKLKGKSSLTTVDLGMTSARGLEFLTEVPNVTTLNLQLTDINDQSLDQVRKLKHLQRLDLRATEVTDRGLLKLADCKNLSWLNLSECEYVTQSGIRALRDELPKLNVKAGYVRVGIFKDIHEGDKQLANLEWEAAYHTFYDCRKRIAELKSEKEKVDLLQKLLLAAHNTQRSEEVKELTAEMLKHPMDDDQSAQFAVFIGADAMNLRVAGNHPGSVAAEKNCIRLFENSCNAKTRGAAICLARAGTWEMESGHWSEAKTLVNRSLKIFADHHSDPDPEYCFALIYAGTMKRHEGDFAAARQYFKRAYEPLRGQEGRYSCAPTVVNMFISLAAMDAKEGKTKEAREALEQADLIARYNHLDGSIRESIKSKMAELGNKN